MLGLLSGRLQGQLQMWVDMLTPAEAARYPKTDISLPRPEELEVCVFASEVTASAVVLDVAWEGCSFVHPVA